ncbi:glycosyltransferase family 25 protein [Herbaspirillum sp. ST 5-3]|uniref:glycosyltransferase family 25 protein n=1 Tax=Oxalobacteraceae TaxID=75682 RepID=UPI0010A31AB9|nr:glycosyltransferase family 25 protein [Herbaspirillum sp. ST 5-3]
MKCFVISLNRTPERLKRFYALNGNRDRIEAFEAVDGRTMDRSSLVREGVIEEGLPYYSDGAIGCALSHKRLWEMAIELDQPITVLEDDAILNHRFLEKTEEICTRTENWDYIQWGWNFDSFLTFMLPGDLSPCVAHFSQDDMRSNARRFQDQTMEHPLYRILAAFGTPAYSISPTGARKLLEWCFPLCELNVYFWGLNRHLPNNGIDIVMNDFYRQPHANAFVSFPPLAITPNEHAGSTVSG